jgi:importin-7
MTNVFFVARKALEEAFEEEDSDIGDEALFNLEDDDGMVALSVTCLAQAEAETDDVFDDETAYLDMLAKEVCERCTYGPMSHILH